MSEEQVAAYFADARAKGYTGLFCDGSCACRMEDEGTCGIDDIDEMGSCEPGYVRLCGECPERFTEDGKYHCEFNIDTGDGEYHDDDWCVGEPMKPKEES